MNSERIGCIGGFILVIYCLIGCGEPISWNKTYGNRKKFALHSIRWLPFVLFQPRRVSRRLLREEEEMSGATSSGARLGCQGIRLCLMGWISYLSYPSLSCLCWDLEWVTQCACYRLSSALWVTLLYNLWFMCIIVVDMVFIYRRLRPDLLMGQEKGSLGGIFLMIHELFCGLESNMSIIIFWYRFLIGFHCSILDERIL